MTRQLAEQGVTMIGVTHAIGFERNAAHRLLRADRRIVKSGPAKEIQNNLREARRHKNP